MLKIKPVSFVSLALIVTLAYADDGGLNKKLIKAPVLGNASVQAQPLNKTPANPSGAVSLNPQPFPPVETTQVPNGGVKPIGVLPAQKTNMESRIPKSDLPPLVPVSGASNTNQPVSGIGAKVSPIGSDLKLGDALKDTRMDACMGKPCIISVNGKNVGNTIFKPGTRYQIVGKKFGNTRGDVVLNIDGDVAVKLAVTAWRDEEIIAFFTNDFGGKPNSNNVALFIDVPNTPRINTVDSQRGKFEALIVKQTIPFGNIPQSAIAYEKGEFGEPAADANGYGFYAYTRSAKETIDSIKHQFTDKIKLGFINPNFKVLDVNTEFGRQDTNGSRCDRCGAGSGGMYVYGSYGHALNNNTELTISRAVWHNHISPNITMDWSDVGVGTLFGGPIGSLIGAAVGIDKKKGGNQFASEVRKLEIIVEGPKGVNPIK